MIAKILDYSVRLSKTNNLMVQVLFQTKESKNYTWFGSLKEGQARNITMATLVKLGLTTPDLEVLNKGVASGALNEKQDYELELKEEKDLEGNMRMRITRIKLPGERSMQELDKDALKAALAASSIKDELTAKLSKKRTPAKPLVDTTNDDEVF